jgi:segregation and condensation protein B
MPLAEERLRAIIESLLLVSSDPVPVQRLVEVIQTEDPSTDADAIKVAAEGLVERYGNPERQVARGFRVEDIGGALQLRTVAENAPYVRCFLTAKPQRLSKPSLETLAIIAYRQPVTKPEVESIRGVDSGATLKLLLERDLVRILGKKEEVGRPIIYGTTKYFLEFFGIRALSELPTLREYHELDEEHQKEVDALNSASDQGKISDLAAAAAFLIEVKEDPDLLALDQAVADADRVRKITEATLDPQPPASGGPEAKEPDPSPDGAAPSEEENEAAEPGS